MGGIDSDDAAPESVTPDTGENADTRDTDGPAPDEAAPKAVTPDTGDTA